MTDLEDTIRDALTHRAHAVSAADLRERHSEPRRPRTLLPALAGAAIVAALAIGIAVVANRATTGSTAPAAGHDATSYTGIDWRLVTVTTNGHIYPTPRKTVRIAFLSGRRVYADDGINFLSGHYRATSSGFVAGDVARTLAGYGGTDPAFLATMAAVGAVTSGQPVVATFRDGDLVLTVQSYTLRLRNAGPATDPGAAPSASPTPSGTGMPRSYVNGSELPGSPAPS